MAKLQTDDLPEKQLSSMVIGEGDKWVKSEMVSWTYPGCFFWVNTNHSAKKLAS